MTSSITDHIRGRAGSLADDHSAVATARDRAVDLLRSLQHRDGWWKGELQTNVTMEAEDLLLRAFLGIATPEVLEPTARWIRSQQRPDGTWATFHDGPGDLSTTIEAWVALRLAGDPADSPHLRRAEHFVRQNGGVERSRVFTRTWLALFGLWPWSQVPDMPPELILFPDWMPLNVYNWGCWARQTIVPLTIVGSIRPVRPLPFGIDELRTGTMPVTEPGSLISARGFFRGADKLLHSYSKRPVRRLRELAMRRGIEWILARQEADGGWGGIQPPWVYSILALTVMGYPMDHPAVRAAIDGLDGFTVVEDTPDGPVRRLEACQSPVWDTALAMIGLLDSGVPGDDPAVTRAARWLLDEQITVGGDWRVRRPDVEPGGWAFEFANDGYPDTDDTAEIVIALSRVRLPHKDHGRVEAAINRAVAWLGGMQSADGGWGAFDADNTKTLATKLPFCDFGAVIDPPSADVTAHIVEMYARLGLGDTTECRRGVSWILDHQEPNGSWFGRWGANHIYGTGAVVPALVAAGIAPEAPAIRRAVAWLHDHQNTDGGWGEDLRSYKDPSWIGRGTSTPSQTAWALVALLAVGERSDVVRRGIAWLVAHQHTDGSWDEDFYTGTGFPGDFYINYHLYRQVFPLWALGRYSDDELVSTNCPDAADHERSGHVRGVIATPTAAEYVALRGRVGSPLLHVGAGRTAALPADRIGTPVLVAGVAGALDPTLRPGTAVVGDEVVGPDGLRQAVPVAPILAGALRRAGLDVRVGAVASTWSMITGSRRAELGARTAALAVDTETAALVARAGQPAVVRVIVDTAQQGLISPGIVPRGFDGLRQLRRAAPVFDAWAEAIGDRELLLAGPRSFCAGVERAIEIVERALEQCGPPVYVRRQIVHNRHVVADLESRGAVFVHEVDEIPEGSLTVLAAHGVAPSVRAEAKARRLRVVDATCPLVTKVHSEVRRFAVQDHTVFLIGHPDHEEVVGTSGEAPGNVVVVASPDAASTVRAADPQKVSYVMQTTLAVDEAERTAAVLRNRFPALKAPRRDDICYATTNRQQAVRAVARRSDLVIVIGSANSSNSHRLAEVAEAEGAVAHLVDDAESVELEWLAGVRRIGITAGASAPPRLVDELVSALSGLGRTTVSEVTITTEDVRFTLPREVS